MKGHGMVICVLGIVFSGLTIQTVLSAQEGEQKVLLINVSGYTGGWDYEPDVHNAFETLKSTQADAVYLNLAQEGQAADLIKSSSFDQIWVMDISHTGTYPADWVAIAA